MPSLEEPGQLVLTMFLHNILLAWELAWEHESDSCQLGLGHMPSLGEMPSSPSLLNLSTELWNLSLGR